MANDYRDDYVVSHAFIRAFFNEIFTQAMVDSGGRHKHQCEECGTVWEHSDQCAGDEDAHTCPNPDCDSVEFWGWHYHGNDEVQYASRRCESAKLVQVS